MTNALCGATLLLAVSLTLYAVKSWTAARWAGTPVLLPSALAALTIVTILAILASGTSSSAGLYFAVVVVVLNGAAWLGWGNALVSSRPHRAGVHA